MAQGIELGTGFVAIEANMDNVNREVRRALDRLDPLAERAGREMGDSIEDGITDGARRGATEAGNATGDAGKKGGKNFVAGFDGVLRGGAGGILDSVKAIPIAGAFIGIGIGAGAALIAGIKDGMSQEASRDLFQAQTTLTEGQARTFAKAAAESYVNVFGESVQANMDTLRIAVRGGIIDASATQGEAESAINYIQTVADVSLTETESVANAISQMLRAGLTDDYSYAADVLVRASKLGANEAGALADAFTSSSATLKQFGLDAETTAGAVVQAMEKGAPSADFFIGALEELAGNAGDAAEDFEGLGLNATDMAERLTGGGDSAKAALDDLFDALRNTDPVTRANTLIALFGEEATAMSEALMNIDISTAVGALGDLGGAAKEAMDVMGNNSATKVEGAMRSIGSAVDEVKGALAEAFGPTVSDWANGIAGNREAIVNFFFAIGNGAITAAEFILKFGEYGARATAAVLDGLSYIAPAAYVAAAAIAAATGNYDTAADLLGKSFTVGAELSDAADDVRGFADTIRDEALPVVDSMRDKFNSLEEGAIATAKVSDAMRVLADGTAVTAGEVDAVKRAMDAEAIAMDNAGRSTDEINRRHMEHIGNLRGVLNQAGLTEQQINDYIAKLDSIPPQVNTELIIDKILRDATDGGAAQANAANQQNLGGAEAGTRTSVGGVEYEAGADGILRRVTPPPATGSGIGRLGPPRTGAGLGDADTYGLGGQQRTFWESFSAQFPDAQITDAGIRTWDDGTGGASYHYSGQALDIAGPNMQAYAEWIAANDPGATELFYDPFGGIKNGEQIGAIGDHGDHVHYVPSGSSSYTANPDDGTAAAADAGASAGAAASSGGSSGGGGGGGEGLDMFATFIEPQIADFLGVFGFSGLPHWWDELTQGMSGGGGGGGGSSSGGSSATGSETSGTSSTASTSASGDTLSAAASQYGWDQGGERAALDELMRRESGGNATAQNPTSTAYGRWQFLDSTWDDVGGTKTSDPALQDQYGMAYIQQRYGSPSAALAFHDQNNWYHDGGEIRGPGRRGDVGIVAQVGEFVVKNGPSQEFREDLEGINSGRGPRRGSGTVNNFNIQGYDPHEVSRQVVGKLGMARMRSRGITIG